MIKLKYKLLALSLAYLGFACNNTKELQEQSEGAVSAIESMSPQEMPQAPEYKAAEARKSDIIHTKLEVSIDWKNEWLIGQATITARPYFYSSSNIQLDARGFDIYQVEANGKKAEYHYDGKKLTIDLGKPYEREEKFTIQIAYKAKPSEIKEKGGTAILSDRGLYFVDSDSSDPKKPTQLWTQGETEANSCWFPTIDAPNERMTQEVFITVDTAYETLSNGEFVYALDNGDGTRTDYWRMSLPHAPYLAMLAVGDFVILEDNWEGIPVNYYMEPEFADYGKNIFGNTPEMIAFYSDLLGVPFPWQKYHQVIVRDFVTGAMENTTAVIHGDFMLQTDRERIDGDYEEVIAHELFHQWFGDLVTCESWSNLPLNESFATYGEYLWVDYKYGRDEADLHGDISMRGYLSESKNKQEPLIRYYYDNTDDLFDAHSYNKGGRVLHMLRNYTGDEAFFAALKHYLVVNSFKSVEIHDLRKAFEEITGEDLNWFFNQWFLSSGHPVLKLDYAYDTLKNLQYVYVEQVQDLKRTPVFDLYFNVDLYGESGKSRHAVRVKNGLDTLSFEVDSPPSWINVDAEKMLLCEKIDNKPVGQWVLQYEQGPKAMDRMEAVLACSQMEDSTALGVLLQALDDPFWSLPIAALQNAEPGLDYYKDAFKEKALSLAKSHENSKVRSNAIEFLASYYEDISSEFYKEFIQDSSYLVISSAIWSTAHVDPSEALSLCRGIDKEVGNAGVLSAIAMVYADQGTAEDHGFFKRRLKTVAGAEKFSMVSSYVNYLLRQEDDIVDEGVEILYEIVRKEEPWWVKLSGVLGLVQLKLRYQDEAETKQFALEQISEEQAGKRAVLESALTHAQSRTAVLQKKLETLKGLTTDERILPYFDH